MKKQQVISYRKDEKISKEAQDKITEILKEQKAEEISISFAKNPTDKENKEDKKEENTICKSIGA